MTDIAFYQIILHDFSLMTITQNPKTGVMMTAKTLNIKLCSGVFPVCKFVYFHLPECITEPGQNIKNNIY